MAGLVIRLAPSERLLLNGAILENGDRRTTLILRSAKANVLRMRDALHPDEVNTPVKRLCFQIQLLISGDTDYSETLDKAEQSTTALLKVFEDPISRQHLLAVAHNLAENNLYAALRSARALLALERELMSRWPS